MLKKFDKPYEDLEKSIRFYRTISVLFIAVILFIGFNNVSTTNKCNKFEKDLGIQQAKNKVLSEELREVKRDIVMGTCLLISKL